MDTDRILAVQAARVMLVGSESLVGRDCSPNATDVSLRIWHPRLVRRTWKTWQRWEGCTGHGWMVAELVPCRVARDRQTLGTLSKGQFGRHGD